MLKEWFKDAVGSSDIAHLKYEKGVAIIYKGFRLFENDEGEITIQDVRFSEFYSEVKDSDLEIMKEHGFIKGCDIILYSRDFNRVEQYTRRLEKLYKNKTEYVKNKDVKKLRICNKTIHDYIDMLFFYKTRLGQLKHKLNEK